MQDDNFRRDTFLRAKAAEDADGWVPLFVLLAFTKIKSLTTDPRSAVTVEVLAESIADSSTLELSYNRAAVRRIAPLPSEAGLGARSELVMDLH